MKSTILKHPDKLFSLDALNLFPPPSPAPTRPVADLPIVGPSQWRLAEGRERTLSMALNGLQTSLRAVHKHKVSWPIPESTSESGLTPSEHLVSLLQPIAGLHNQLYSPAFLNKAPMECKKLDLGECTYPMSFFLLRDFPQHFKVVGAATFTAEISKSVTANNPLFDSKGMISPQLEYAVAKALELQPSTRSVFATNFQDTIVFRTPDKDRPYYAFEKITPQQPMLAFTTVSTAYLHDSLPSGSFISIPDEGLPKVDENIFPQGPANDPGRSLTPDDELFATHHCNSDFDILTLLHDKPRALQFFRWRRYVAQHSTKVLAHPNDALIAMTNEVGIPIPPSHSIFPFDWSEVPPDTAQYLKSVHHDCPLAAIGLLEPLKKSRTFTLTIEDVPAEGTSHGLCTVYKCRITSIDKTPVTSPTLCLKLFDDRFQPFIEPEVYGPEVPVARWFDSIVVAEGFALNEAAAYDQLLPVQCSAVPWFYGTHQFTLPDGKIVYGLLMEFIEGEKLGSGMTRTWGTEQQISVIESCRHLARVLNIADIRQFDWHTGQILLCHNPGDQRDHAALIDFTLTTQTYAPEVRNHLDSYVGILRTLLVTDTGLDSKLVWKHFGEPDDCDPVRAILIRRPGSLKMTAVRAGNLFPFVTSA